MINRVQFSRFISYLYQIFTNRTLLVRVTFVLLFFSIGLVNTFHESYPDEFDNILGGRYLLEGKHIYSDFFTHHGPVAYYIASIPQLFSGSSFVMFRVIYSLLLCIYLLWTFRFISRRFELSYSRLYLIFLVALQISLTYFWGHMLLADSIAALFFLPVFVYCIGLSFYQVLITRRDLVIVSSLIFLGLFSSFTYLFASLFFYTFLLIVYLRQHFTSSIRTIFQFILLSSLPYLCFLLLFALQGNLDDFFAQALQFNTRYYLYNYPRPEGSTQFNPLRYAIVIFYTFFNQLYSLLTQISRINLQYPVNLTLAVVFVSFLSYLLLYRKYLLAFFIAGVVTYANVRSLPLSSTPPDYQISVYFVLTLFTSVFLVYSLYSSIQSGSHKSRRLVMQFLFVMCSFLLFFSSLALFKQFLDKAYMKYMGTAPLIYDRPDIAPMINAATSRNDSAWIGPFAFEDLWYMHAAIPSRYQIIIPAMKNTDYVSRLAHDIAVRKPKVVYFDPTFFILGTKTETFSRPVLSVLDSDYVRYLDYRENGTKYISVKPITLEVDVEAKLYIRKDAISEVTSRLLRSNFIRAVPESQ